MLDPLTGQPDASFADDGLAYGFEIFAGVTLPMTPAAVAVDSGGRIVIGGTLLESLGVGAVRRQPVLGRLLANGAADTSFTGSVASRFPATGVVTLRAGSTNRPDIDFGGDAAIVDLALDADDSVLAAGWRTNAEGHTDLSMFAFDEDGVPSSSYNVVGFLIEDGSSADNSFEGASSLLAHSTGSIWTLGTSRPSGSGSVDQPVIWIDRDPRRAFAPLGQ